MRFRRKGVLLPLLIGTFSQTQVNIVGNVGLSELVCFALAPFVFLKDLGCYRHDRNLLFFLLSVALIAGCCVSGAVNHTATPFFLRGLGTTYAVFSGCVCLYHVLRKDVGLFKYLLLGFAISMTLNVFVFHYGAEEAKALSMGGNVVENIQSDTLFWFSRGSLWLQLPMKGWYLSTPLPYSVVAAAFMGVYAIAFTASGRSAALGMLSSIVFILVGRKSPKRMRMISRNFLLFLILGVLFALAFKSAYTCLGKKGLLNKGQQVKFENQTKGGSETSALKLLMSGRAEFFCGAYAALKRPLVGYGPWPIDHDRLYLEFLAKYGDYEDYERASQTLDFALSGGKYALLPSHSWVVEFWQWFGLPGLVFMLYVLHLMIQYVRKYLDAIPHLYGYLAVGIPDMLWGFFFSPFGSRLIICCFWVVLLLNRAIARGRVPMPADMQREIAELKRKER